MSAPANVTKSANINVTAREIDFVTRFGMAWEALLDIMGVVRPVKKTPGAVLKSKSASVTLQSGAVAEGDEIPYSQSSVVEKTYAEMTAEKYLKGVTLEAIKDHGYDVAVALTDEAFLNELQGNVMDRFYTYAKTGRLTNIQNTFQMALAYAKGLVINKFKGMHRTVTDVVAFVNVLDVYEYIGAAGISVQSQFGFQYIKDFMGYGTVFLCSDAEIPRGKIVATPVENIVLYYIDPSDSDFAKAGLEYTVQGETNLIGFHTEGNYKTATSDSYAIMGMVLFAEYIDGVAVVDIAAASTAAKALTITSEAIDGSTTKTLLKRTAGDTSALYAYVAAGEVSVTFGQAYSGSGDPIDFADLTEGVQVTATNGSKYTVIGVNATGQVVSSGVVTAVVNT